MGATLHTWSSLRFASLSCQGGVGRRTRAGVVPGGRATISRARARDHDRRRDPAGRPNRPCESLSPKSGGSGQERRTPGTAGVGRDFGTRTFRPRRRGLRGDRRTGGDPVDGDGEIRDRAPDQHAEAVVVPDRPLRRIPRNLVPDGRGGRVGVQQGGDHGDRPDEDQEQSRERLRSRLCVGPEGDPTLLSRSGALILRARPGVPLPLLLPHPSPRPRLAPVPVDLRAPLRARRPGPRSRWRRPCPPGERRGAGSARDRCGRWPRRARR